MAILLLFSCSTTRLSLVAFSDHFEWSHDTIMMEQILMTPANCTRTEPNVRKNRKLVNCYDTSRFQISNFRNFCGIAFAKINQFWASRLYYNASRALYNWTQWVNVFRRVLHFSLVDERHPESGWYCSVIYFWEIICLALRIVVSFGVRWFVHSQHLSKSNKCMVILPSFFFFRRVIWNSLCPKDLFLMFFCSPNNKT